MSEAKLSTVILVFTVVGVVAYVISSGPQAIENVWRKIKLVGFGTLHILLSRDKRFKAEVSECLHGDSCFEEDVDQLLY